MPCYVRRAFIHFAVLDFAVSESWTKQQGVMPCLALHAMLRCVLQVIDMSGPEPEIVRAGKGDVSMFEA